MEPSLNGTNGYLRDQQGRFGKGTRGGPGNPLGKKCNELRAELLGAVGVDDIREIGRRLLEMAKAGDLGAVSQLLDRLFGRPLSGMVATKLDGEIAAALDVTEMTDQEFAIYHEHMGALVDLRESVAKRQGHSPF